jgi:hypothetical protein
MGNPWEAPDHTNPVYGPQHHAPPNPTQSSADPGLLGGSAGGGGWQAPPVTQDPRLAAQYADYRFLWVAILLALFLGPLGVFYVGFLNGIGASVLVVAAGRTLFSALTAATGAPLDDTQVVEFGLAVIWGISIPWAIIGTKVRNARRARRRS